MKVTAVFVAALATASAFAPSVSNSRITTELMAVKKEAPKKATLFNTIFNMDLFAPVSTQNDYGARDKKNVSWSEWIYLICILNFQLLRYNTESFLYWTTMAHFLTPPVVCFSLQLKVAKIGSNSYIPAGLTPAQFQKIRDEDAAKKSGVYKKNVAKAGKFQDYTAFYIKRGTDTTDAWIKTATRGHDMAKTKYDFSGKVDLQKSYDGKA